MASQFERRLQVTFWLLMTGLVTLGIGALRNSAATAEDTAAIARARDLLAPLVSTSALIRDAEICVLKYVATGDTSFVSRFESDRTALAPLLATLHRLVADDATESALVDSIDAASQSQLAAFQDVVDRHALDATPPAPGAPELRDDRVRVEQIREMVASLTTRESRALAEHTAAIESRRQVTNVIVLGGALLGILVLLLGTRVLAREFGQRVEADARSRAILDSQPVTLLIVDRGGTISLTNLAAERLFGYTRQELVGAPIEKLVPKRFRARHPELVAGYMGHAEPRAMGAGRELFALRKDGSEFPVEIGLTPLATTEGTFAIASVVDLTAHFAVERETRRAVDEYRQAVLENVVDAVCITDADGKFLDCNPRCSELTGYTREELLQHGNIIDTYPPEERPSAEDRMTLIVLRRVTNVERGMLRKDGTIMPVQSTSVLLPDGRVLTTTRDMSERRKTDAQLRQSVQRFRELAENVQEVFFVMEPTHGRTLYVNPAYELVFGQSREHGLNTPYAWAELIHPEDRESVLAAERESTGAGESMALVYRIVRPDGAIRWIRSRSTPIKDETGRTVRLVGVAEDISDLKRTEDQYRQAQKMEAVGRLAGGVAHDFNNILTAILGHSEFLLTDLPADSAYRSDATEIRTAALRAAELTNQLLAFSRRQVLQLSVLSLNAVVTGLEGMLRRLIGEQVVLDVHLHAETGNVRSDASQLEQVIVNLAVNARDAMPNGGTLTIETANVDLTADFDADHQAVKAGPYVMIAVSDTGVGISLEARARMFEPFFTTKEQGKGTGLGLSMVYGIVKQSGGYIWVYSEPGHGTTFKIYLPRVTAPADAVLSPSPIQGAPGGTETILLAEDDDQLRKLAHGFLGRLGYRILSATNATEAMALAREFPDAIHLLLTDVVMPGESGSQLAEQLAETRPAMRVLYMSGYTDNGIVDKGILEKGLAFLQKPFTPVLLAQRIRQVLDSA